MEQQAKKSFLIDFTFGLIVAALVFVIGKFTLQYLTPFVLAAVIAYVMQKPARFISAKIKIPKGICAAVLAAGVYILSAAVILLVLYRLISVSAELFDELPHLFSYNSDTLSGLEERFYRMSDGLSPEFTDEILSVIKETLEGLTLKLTNAFSSSAASFAKSAPSFIFSSIVALVASCYIAKDYDGLKKFLSELLGKKIYGNIAEIKLILSQSVLKLVKGYAILSFITFLELAIGFLVMKIEYAFILAAAVAVIDLLPVLGTGTVLVPWSIILLAAGDTFKGIGILLLYLITVVVRNVAEPKVIGGQMGINPLFTLLAMFAGLKLFGFWGLFMFPIALIVIIKYYKNEMEREKE